MVLKLIRNHHLIGLNSRLDTIQAGVLKEKLNFPNEKVTFRIEKLYFHKEKLCFLKESWWEARKN